MNDTAQIKGSSGHTILFVHGSDFKPDAAEVLELCDAAIEAGLKRDYPDCLERYRAVEKSIAYYGDLNNAFLSGLGRKYDKALDIGDRRNVLQSLAAIDKRKNFGVHRYDRVPGKTAVAEFAATVFGPVLGRLGLSNAVIAKLCVDLGEYWNKESDFDAQTRARVRTEIIQAMQSGNHVMLITHGTGCVLAYDALWELSHDEAYAGECGDGKIDTWITTGAPLGDSLVRKRLLGSDRKGREQFPSNVVSWLNVSAEDDYLSHDNTLADDFKRMLRQRQVSCIRDYRVYNLAVRYGKSNPHNSIGYLIHPRIAQFVNTWLDEHSAAETPMSSL